MRILLLTSVALRLWVGYGSAKPASYEPFWRLTRFLYSLGMTFAVVTALFLCRLKRWSWLASGGLGCLCVLAVAASGPWGQADDISRELCEYAGAHPAAVYWTDPRSLREMTVWSDGRPPANIHSGAEQAGWRVGSSTPLLFLQNPLHLRERPANRPERRLIPSACYGPALHETTKRLRRIAVLLPRRVVDCSEWFVRRPAGRVLPVLKLGGCK